MARTLGGEPSQYATGTETHTAALAADSQLAPARKGAAARELSALARFPEIRPQRPLTPLPRQLGGASASGKEASVEFLRASLEDLRSGPS